jgi:predicted DNA-binding protein with PD1-like motif
MQYSIGKTGRVIVLRLEDGEPLYASIEKTARDEQVSNGVVWVIGGMKNGKVVVGPKDGLHLPPEVMVETFTDPHEILGVGTLFANENGDVSLHLHAAMGRGTDPLVGCPRQGADCWLINEVIIMEILDVKARRKKSSGSGLALLAVEE